MDQSLSPQRSPAEAANRLPTFIPRADIFETKDAIVMLLDVPGADPESLDVTLDKRDLTISAKTTQPSPQGATPVHVEFEAGKYERAFTLSDEIDGEHIDAAFKDGVLRLNLPRISPPPAKKITVKPA
jgi:HSP20 family molecular chaperone IbpA